MNLDDFFISGIAAEENNFLVEISVYIANNDDINDDTYLFSLRKDLFSGSISFIENNSLHSLQYRYDLTPSGINELIHHFKKLLFSKYGGFDNIQNVKNNTINNFNNYNFNDLNSEKTTVDNIHKFRFFNNEKSEFLTLHYNFDNKKVNIFMISFEIDDLFVDFFIDDASIYKEYINKTLDKIKNTNKYRIPFLFEAK